MARRSFLTRFGRLSWRQKALLAEASARLAWASFAVAFLPFAKVIVSASRSRLPLRASSSSAIGEYRWAIAAAARELPLRLVCIHQSLALQAMLRRRGIDARLHYGVRDESSEGLKAHVWLTVHDRIVLGEAGHDGFARLYSVP